MVKLGIRASGDQGIRRSGNQEIREQCVSKALAILNMKAQHDKAGSEPIELADVCLNLSNLVGLLPDGD